jgi:hypothetical protein
LGPQRCNSETSSFASGALESQDFVEPYRTPNPMPRKKNAKPSQENNHLNSNAGRSTAVSGPAHFF